MDKHDVKKDEGEMETFKKYFEVRIKRQDLPMAENIGHWKE